MKIAVASKNPVKIEAVREAFAECFSETFTLEGIAVHSGVSDQPMGNKETWQGARNRADALMSQYPEYDFFVGIEGGVEMLEGQMMAFAWMVVKTHQREGSARTSGFFLPAPIAELVQKGYELGEADDLFFKKENSKQQNGAVGLLTRNVMTRRGLYVPALILSLIPFVNPDLYPSKKRV